MRNWDELNRNIADTLYDVVSGARSAKDGIKDFFDTLASQILRNITDDWADALTDMLKGFGKGGNATAFGANSFSSGGSWWQTLLGAFGFGGGFADGGFPDPWTVNRVNERGMEMATVRGRDYLLTGGSPVEITPAHKLGGRGLTVNNQFAFAAPTSKETQMQVAKRTALELSRAQARR